MEREREKRWRKEMSENDDELDKLVQAEKIGSTVPTYLPTYLLHRQVNTNGKKVQIILSKKE